MTHIDEKSGQIFSPLGARVWAEGIFILWGSLFLSQFRLEIYHLLVRSNHFWFPVINFPLKIFSLEYGSIFGNFVKSDSCKWKYFDDLASFWTVDLKSILIILFDYYFILIFSIYWSNKSLVIELLSRPNVKNLEICGVGWPFPSPKFSKRYDSVENGRAMAPVLDFRESLFIFFRFRFEMYRW